MPFTRQFFLSTLPPPMFSLSISFSDSLLLTPSVTKQVSSLYITFWMMLKNLSNFSSALFRFFDAIGKKKRENAQEKERENEDCLKPFVTETGARNRKLKKYV